jgi:hypothetical protein
MGVSVYSRRAPVFTLGKCTAPPASSTRIRNQLCIRIRSSEKKRVLYGSPVQCTAVLLTLLLRIYLGREGTYASQGLKDPPPPGAGLGHRNASNNEATRGRSPRVAVWRKGHFGRSVFATVV